MRVPFPAAGALLMLSSAVLAQTAAVSVEDQPSEALKLVRQVRPVYPPEAKAAAISGRVRLAATVGKDGRILELKITSGHPLLAAAAYDAVRQWEYAPVEMDGQPVEVKADIELEFSLSGDGPAPLTVPGSKQQGKLVSLVRPAYPAEAKQQHIEGLVRLRAVIGKTGAVESVYVRDGDPALTAAAVEAVKQWQYSPTTVDGAPAAVITDIDVNFSISR